MIPLVIIMVFLGTIITLFFNSLAEAWKDLGKETKNVYATSVQNFIEEIKKDFADKPAKRRTKEPDNFEESPDEVKAWCQRIMLFFQSNDISKE